MSKIDISFFISGFGRDFGIVKNLPPWEIIPELSDIIKKIIPTLGDEFVIRDGIAIHKTAVVEEHVILKPPVIIHKNCFIGSHAYLRNGVYLGEGGSVGPGCEVKSSIIFGNTEIAHLNFIGDSIIGSHCNFEAGSITANYFNERKDKAIFVYYRNEIIPTHTNKFGSLVGDNCKIGANAVLSPGTILEPGSIVKRLELIEQISEK